MLVQLAPQSACSGAQLVGTDTLLVAIAVGTALIVAEADGTLSEPLVIALGFALPVTGGTNAVRVDAEDASMTSGPPPSGVGPGSFNACGPQCSPAQSSKVLRLQPRTRSVNDNSQLTTSVRHKRPFLMSLW
jgi:hypothetical protein